MSVSVVQGLKKMKTLSMLQVFYGLGGISAFFIFISMKIMSFKAIFFASSIDYLIVSLLIALIFRKYIFFGFNKVLAIKIVKYGFFVFICSMAYVIYSNFDRIIINKFLGATQVGIYGAYYVGFISSSTYIFSIFNSVFFPIFSASKNKEILFKKIVNAMIRLSLFILLFLLLVGIAVISLYGSKYKFNFWLSLLFSVAAIFSVFNAILVSCMSATGFRGIRDASFILLIAAAVNVLVNILLVPLCGFFGAVVAIISSYFISIFIISSKRGYYKIEEEFSK
jgi:O-antigen/teichoic acid export membrane protein